MARVPSFDLDNISSNLIHVYFDKKKLLCDSCKLSIIGTFVKGFTSWLQIKEKMFNSFVSLLYSY